LSLTAIISQLEDNPSTNALKKAALILQGYGKNHNLPMDEEILEVCGELNTVSTTSNTPSRD
jgi:hypothetical protein